MSPPLHQLADGLVIEPIFARGSSSGARLTVGLPCFNRPELLAEALASIAAQRDPQTIDVLVSDDGGLPETRRVVEASTLPNVRLFTNTPALGPVRNWNRCIELAATPWVTILHEDDLLYPWFTEVVTPLLRDGGPALSVRCIQGARPATLSRPAKFEAASPYAPVWFLKASMTPFPGVVFSREAAIRIGGFDPHEEGLADYAFWYALACAQGIRTVRTTAAFYRVNEGQWTERAWPTMLRRAHLLRLRIAREQLPNRPTLGRWIARFYTARMARAYRRRFGNGPAVLSRAEKFARIPAASLPSGWVWALLKRLA